MNDMPDSVPSTHFTRSQGTTAEPRTATPSRRPISGRVALQSCLNHLDRLGMDRMWTGLALTSL